MAVQVGYFALCCDITFYLDYLVGDMAMTEGAGVWVEYEVKKQKIIEQARDSKEYERLIKELCEKLGI